MIILWWSIWYFPIGKSHWLSVKYRNNRVLHNNRRESFIVQTFPEYSFVPVPTTFQFSGILWIMWITLWYDRNWVKIYFLWLSSFTERPWFFVCYERVNKCLSCTRSQKSYTILIIFLSLFSSWAEEMSPKMSQLDYSI